MKSKTYTLYKDGQKYETTNLAAFCRDNGLQRRHMNEVLFGKRRSHRGWSLQPTTVTIEEAPAGDTVAVEDVLTFAEIAARSSNDPDYEKLVLDRVAQVRRGEPIEINIAEDDPGYVELKEAGIIS